PDARAALDATSGFVALDGPPPVAPDPASGPLEVSLAELRRFLRSPLQETARRRGLPEPEGAARGDAEPFALTPRARTTLLRATFVAAWAGDGVLSERLAAEHEAALARL